MVNKVSRCIARLVWEELAEGLGNSWSSLSRAFEEDEESEKRHEDDDGLTSLRRHHNTFKLGHQAIVFAHTCFRAGEFQRHHNE